MSVADINTQEIIAKFGRTPTDTGSSEVQIALITARMNELAPHFKANMKDHHSRRGLLRLVSRRRSLLDYLKATKPETYKSIIATLGIRK